MDEKNRLICRKGFGYVLVVYLYDVPNQAKEGTFVFKTPDWGLMQEKIKQAEQLYDCQCGYENFRKDELAEMVMLRSGIFDHPFFRKAPAMASLQTIAEPKPEHVRACLLELTRYVTARLDKME